MDEQRKRLIEIVVGERSKFMGYVRRKAAEMSHMDAEDILADVVFNIFDKADIAGHIENLTAYIYRALANKISDYRRQKRPAVSMDNVDSENEMPLVDRLADPAADIEQTLERRDLRERLYDAVSRLEPKQRAVWIATEIEGSTFRDLSAEWNEPIGTLLSRKNRAVKALRAMLKDVVEE
jgi:RNA polymerase sigma factor (sigma-70 family)